MPPTPAPPGAPAPVPPYAVPPPAAVSTAPATAPPRRKRRGRLRGFFQGIFALLLIAAIGLGATFGVRYQDSIRLAISVVDWHAVEETARSVPRRALELVSEEPRFADVPGPEVYPICESATPDDIDRLMPAMDMMRRTGEGMRLFGVLVDYGVCVGVEDITYNSGYAYAAQSGLTGSWSRSYIMVDTDVLRSGETDVVAALLVHESTHIDRYIRGLACNYTDTCTELANGVALEEELAAHTAEAEWWIAAYGEDGKWLAIGYDYGLNQLVEAYLDGPETFTEYVRSLRGDPREGSW